MFKPQALKNPEFVPDPTENTDSVALGVDTRRLYFFLFFMSPSDFDTQPGLEITDEGLQTDQFNESLTSR